MSVPTTAPTRGFTLLELLISVVIMSMLFYATAVSMRTGSDVSEQTLGDALRSANAGRILHEMAMEVRSADKDYLYETDVDDVLTFNYRPCIGFNMTTGAPLYANSGDGTIVEYDKSAGTLVRITRDGTEEHEEMLARYVAPDGFSVERIGSNTSNVVYGQRIQLNLTLCRDQEDLEVLLAEDASPGSQDPDEVQMAESRTTSADRVVFLRSWLYGKDGAGTSGESGDDGTGSDTTGGNTANDGSTTNDGTIVDDGTNTTTTHEAKDPDPEDIPHDLPTQTEQEENPETKYPTITFGEPTITDNSDPDAPTKIVRVTITGAAVSYTQGGGGKVRTGTMDVSLSSISWNLPNHLEEYYTATFSDGQGQVDDQNGLYYLDIEGPWVGSMPITVSASSPNQTFGNDSFTGGTTRVTNNL